jgi:hypothetical protein
MFRNVAYVHQHNDSGNEEKNIMEKECKRIKNAYLVCTNELLKKLGGLDHLFDDLLRYEA